LYRHSELAGNVFANRYPDWPSGMAVFFVVAFDDFADLPSEVAPGFHLCRLLVVRARKIDLDVQGPLPLQEITLEIHADGTLLQPELIGCFARIPDLVNQLLSACFRRSRVSDLDSYHRFLLYNSMWQS
jgi:hypothetical protein